jgi:DNA-binding MarR family transcriptional regulator
MTQTQGAAEALNNAAAPPLAQLLETEGQVRMLEIFLTRDSLWITSEELAEYAAIDQSTVSRNRATLQRADLVEARGSNPTEYRLNADSAAAQYLREVHSVLADKTQEIQAMFGDDLEVEIGDMTSGSPFVLLFSQPSRVALLDAMLSRGSLWATRERLAELTDVDQSTVKRHLDPLQEVGLVTKRDGSWPYEYRLARGLDIVDALEEAQLQLTEYTNTLRKATQPQPPEITYPDDRTTVAQAIRERLSGLDVALDTADASTLDSNPIHDRIKSIFSGVESEPESAAQPKTAQWIKKTTASLKNKIRV